MTHTEPRATLHRMLTEQPRRLVRRVRPMTRSLTDAEDLAHDIVIRALKGVDALDTDDEALVCAWLDAIARNTAISAARTARRCAVREPHDADLPAQPSAERVATHRLGWRRLIAALGDLPPNEAAVVQLRLIDGLSSTHAARQLGITEQAVRNRLHRARARLRAATE